MLTRKPAPGPQVRRRRLRRWGTGTAVVGALAGAAALAWPQISAVRSPHAMDDVAPLSQPGTHPLGHPPEVRHGVGSFSFAAEQQMSERPVAYDPCRAVPYAINEHGAPPGTDAIVDDAVTAVSRATGLVFLRRPQPARLPTYDSVDTRYGRSPVVISWTTPRAVPGLRGETTGLGRSVYMTDGPSAQRHYVTGAVALDTPQLDALLPRPAGAAQVRAAVMHALAQVVGLDDVAAPDELMSRGGTRRLSFGPGDREGLAALGSGPCF